MILNQSGGSRTDTLVKLILVFFISLLSFSVGTFVGKQFSDSQHRLASLENEYNKDSGENRDVASIPADGEKDDSQPKEILSHEDVSKLAEEFVQEKPGRTVANAPEGSEAPVVADKKDVAEKPADKKEMPMIGSLKKEKEVIDKLMKEKNAKVAVNIAKTPAEKVAEGKAPLDPVKPKIDIKKETKNLPVTVAGDTQGKYTIQVSSHQTENEAKTRVQELTNKGYVASYIPATIDGKTWYRVGVGSFTNVKSAKDYLAKLKVEPTFKSAIIRQIVQ